MAVFSPQTENLGQNTSLVAFGDSITYGVHTTTPDNIYVNIIAANKGWTLTNNGVSGSRINDPAQIDAMYATTVTNTSNFTLLTGTNDMRQADTDKSLQDGYRLNLQAGLAWLAIPDSYKYRGNAASTTGTWSTTVAYAGMGKMSTTNGSTMTFTVKGSVIYIGYILRDIVGAGTFSVTVDGTVRGTYSSIGKVEPRSDTSSKYGAALVRIPGLNNVEHTVVITVTSATSSTNEVYIDWVAGNGFPKTISGPNVWVGNCIKATATGYASYGGSDAAVGQFNNHITEVVGNLSRDGLNICLVDAMGCLDYSNDIYTDGLHPDDSGHAAIASAFLQQMSSAVKPKDKHYINQYGTGWIIPTFQNSWVNYGTGAPDAAYMKDSEGFVHLRGLIKSGSIGDFAIFTLPVGYRPSGTISFPVRSNNAFGYAEVASTGDVKARGGSNVHFCLDSITFQAEG